MTPPQPLNHHRHQPQMTPSSSGPHGRPRSSQLTRRHHHNHAPIPSDSHSNRDPSHGSPRSGTTRVPAQPLAPPRRNTRSSRAHLPWRPTNNAWPSSGTSSRPYNRNAKHPHRAALGATTATWSGHHRRAISPLHSSNPTTTTTHSTCDPLGHLPETRPPRRHRWQDKRDTPNSLSTKRSSGDHPPNPFPRRFAWDTDSAHSKTGADAAQRDDTVPIAALHRLPLTFSHTSNHS